MTYEVTYDVTLTIEVDDEDARVSLDSHKRDMGWGALDEDHAMTQAAEFVARHRLSEILSRRPYNGVTTASWDNLGVEHTEDDG